MPNYVRHPGADWIQSNWSKLPNNSWVAADENGLVTSAGDMDGLQSNLRSKQRTEDEVTIAFVTTDPV